MHEGGGYVFPLPPLLAGGGGRGGDEEAGEGVDKEEGESPAPGHQPPVTCLLVSCVTHPQLHDPAQGNSLHSDMSTN